MLIKTGYQNLLHSCNFLCFELMNEFEKQPETWKSVIETQAWSFIKPAGLVILRIRLTNDFFTAKIASLFSSCVANSRTEVCKLDCCNVFLSIIFCYSFEPSLCQFVRTEATPKVWRRIKERWGKQPSHLSKYSRLASYSNQIESITISALHLL